MLCGTTAFSDELRALALSIKDGPIRVIRQTRNQVRVVWRFKSPSVDIDYVLYGNHILMDTLLDLPFPIGWLFKELTTFASLDMSPGHNLQLYVPDTQEWLAMDGRMSVQEMQFNRAGHKDFVLNHPDGTLAGTSYLSHSLPIYWQITLQDDVQQPDPPETIPGQIGNIGFDTRNWESVDGRVHHLYYSFYLLQETPATKARSILLQGPSYGTP